MSIISSRLRGDRRPLYIGCAVLTAFSLLRGYVGTDTYSYHQQFLAYSDVSLDWLWSLSLEPSFLLLVNIIASIGTFFSVAPDVLSFVYVASISLIQGLLLFLILRIVRNPHLFLFFYTATFYINFHFNILRAATATLAACLSILLLLDPIHRRSGFVLLYTTPFIHYGAIIIVPIILTYDAIVNRKYLRLLGVLAAALLVLGLAWMVLLNIPELGVLADKYEYYIDDRSTSIGIGFLLNMILMLLLIATALYQHKVDLVFFGVPVLILRVYALRNPGIDRVMQMLYPILVLLLVQRTTTNTRAIVTVLVFILGAINGLSAIASLPEADKEGVLPEYQMSPYIPYRTIFEQI